MSRTPVKVDSHSGYKSEERPVRFELGNRTYRVLKIIDRWYEPEDSFFKVQADDGNIYILRNRLAAGWTLEAFRSCGRNHS